MKRNLFAEISQQAVGQLPISPTSIRPTRCLMSVCTRWNYIASSVWCSAERKVSLRRLTSGASPHPPTAPFSRSRGLSTPTTPQRLFLAPLRNALVSNIIPLLFYGKGTLGMGQWAHGMGRRSTSMRIED
jgi:hypothetical protein